MDSQEFLEILRHGWPELPEEAARRVSVFRERLVDENARQNLTKLIAPQDFFEGHVLDVKALLACGLTTFPAMDLGSGCGVPGLLAAIIQPQPWVLAESEGHKATFLARCVDEMGLKDVVQVHAGRAEAYWSGKPCPPAVQSIVCRAVGPVERIYGWLRSCSTWNNLILLKGPRWSEEWDGFERGHHRGELKQTGHFEYEVGAEAKKRIIVRLERVPRGTKQK